MALYNPKSLGSLMAEVALADRAVSRRKMPWSLGGHTLSMGKMFSEVFAFVFVGMRGLLARAHTDLEPIGLHTRGFNPSQLQ